MSPRREIAASRRLGAHGAHWVPVLTTFPPKENGTCSADPAKPSDARSSMKLYSQVSWGTSVGVAETDLHAPVRYEVAPFKYCSRGNLPVQYSVFPGIVNNGCWYK